MGLVVRQSKIVRQRELSARSSVVTIDTAALTSLYRQHLAECDDGYLRTHSGNAAVIARHVNAALLYEPYIGMRILDWGCKHGVDAFFVGAMRGGGVILDGCDFDPPERYASFHDAADMEYRQLWHPWDLPYADGAFDTVIASGVIEHVPQTAESLKELWRIIKTDGHLIVTFLPNRRSYTEWISRCTGGLRHLKLFDIAGFRDMLLHHGFEPIAAGYHQFMPTLAGHSGNGAVQRLISAGYRLNDALERIPLVRSFAANIYMISQRCDST